MSTRTNMKSAQLSEVSDGVFAYVQPDGGWCLNNAGIVVSAGHSALVDTVATESRARRLRAAALDLSPEPPRMVINTHFHGDHTFGNFVFPEAVVVGHERCRIEMLEAGLLLTGLWPDVKWGFIELVPPSLTYHESLTIHIGSIQAELVHIGPAHTSNDTVVWLPEQRVLFTGDLVMVGVTPFCPMGSVAGSLAALERLRGFGARTIVPGHGPVSGPEVFDQAGLYLRWLQELATQGVAAGLSPLETARAAGVGPAGRLLDPERLVPNLHRAFAEERGLPPAVPLEFPRIQSALEEMMVFHGGVPHCAA